MSILQIFKNKIFSLFSLGFIFCATTFNGQSIVASLDNNITDFTSVDIGFNRRSDNGNWWSDNSFKSLVAEINPDIIRYPGGTQANYWNWRTGEFIENTDKTWGGKEILTIPKFVSVIPQRTKVVYVVNMARPTLATGVDVNSSEAILKNDATLFAKIDDMKAAINEFISQGKEPFAVELGNEFYFGNEEGGIYHIVETGGFFYSGWNTATNLPYKSNSKNQATEINAFFYLEHCKKIIEALKSDFPNLKFALTTTKSGNGNSSRESWNNTLFNELKNNPNYAIVKDNVYAVTQHHYLNETYGIQTVINNVETAKVAIAEGIQYPLDKIADYNLVPNDFKIWYTEYGETKEIAEETWASAVRYASLMYSWISLGNKVGQLDWHYISDNNVINPSNPMKLAPVGIAAKLLSTATTNMDEMQLLNFTNNPISVDNVKSLYGVKFKNNQKEAVIIINTNSNNFNNVKIDNLFSYQGIRKMTQYFSNEPHISRIAEGNTIIKTNNAIITNSAIIKKFSISVIVAENNVLSTDDNLIDSFSIQPNPLKDELTIRSTMPVKSIIIFDLSGKRVSKIKNVDEENIDVSFLKQGVYFLNLTTDKGNFYKKMVKL